MTNPTTTTEWLTRSGAVYKAETVIRNFGPRGGMLGSPDVVRTYRQGKPYEVDLAKGSAKYEYEDVCGRCGGPGGASQWSYTGWTCYLCGGTGKGPVRTGRLYTAERLAKVNAAQAKRDATRMAKHQAAVAAAQQAAEAAREAFCAAHRELVDDLRKFAATDEFLANLMAQLEARGELSTGQLEAAQTAVDRLKARQAAREASQFVGTVGERREFVVTIERVIRLQSNLPSYYRTASYLHLCRDQDGNRIVYTGSGNIGAAEATVRLKATVLAHDTYNDEKQTKIARPKVTGTREEDGKFYTWDHATGAMVPA